jgi:hypothetical protein
LFFSRLFSLWWGLISFLLSIVEYSKLTETYGDLLVHQRDLSQKAADELVNEYAPASAGVWVLTA